MASLTGSFLVARTVLQDPSFNQTVVLLLQHSEEGAFGLVVNRPAPAKGLPFPLYKGGPCKCDGLLLLHGQPDWVDSEDDEEPEGIAPGIFLGDASLFNRIKDDLPDGDGRFRLFSGYAGWGPDQLENEIAIGAWTIVPASGEVLFDTPPKELWDRLSPPLIPQPSLN